VTGGPYGFDTETHLIARGRLVPRMVCLQVAGWGAAPHWARDHHADHCHLERTARGWWAVYDRTAAAAVVPHLFAAACVVAHNAPFDLAVLMRYAPDSVQAVVTAVATGRVVDTKVRERLLRIAGRVRVRRRRRIGSEHVGPRGVDTAGSNR